MIRQTHTVAELAISADAYDEIARLLTDAGYDHVFYDGVMDMTGIGLTRSANVILVSITRTDADGTRTDVTPPRTP